MEEGMLWCLPCLDEKLVFMMLRDSGPPSGSCLNSSLSKAVSGPKRYAMQENLWCMT
jgi:hypothetical protein